MKKAFLLITTLVLLLIGAAINSYSQPLTQNSKVVQNPDSLAINLLVNRFYQTLSFEKMSLQKYDSLPTFFIPQGLLVSNVGAAPLFLTVKQFIDGAKENFPKQQITSWNEYEVCARTELFGKIAHRFSTYKIRFIANGKETLRTGINAIQLIKQHDSWLITSIAWDKESQDLKIPARYLCQ